MESQEQTRRNVQETPDPLASMIAGGIFCLAIYGGVKLLQKEMNQAPLPGSGVDSEILNKIVDQELNS